MSRDPGDDADFTDFVASTSVRLLHTAELLTGQRAQAEDLLQHALAQAYLRWPKLRHEQPEAYVRRSMLNAYLDWWRRRRWRELLSDEQPLHTAALGDLAEDLARRDLVQRAMRTLTARERAVVVLRFWCDLSEVRIADELGIAVGTVKSTNARALSRMRQSESANLIETDSIEKAK